jgi:hypothetical protein
MNESINETGLNELEETRREFIKAAGKLAMYTPPAVMLLMRPSTKAIAQSAGRPENFDVDSSEGFGLRAPPSTHGRIWYKPPRKPARPKSKARPILQSSQTRSPPIRQL